jgi:hypothetical protein
LSEEEFECMELLRNAFDIIKPVNAYDDFDAVEALFKGSDTPLNGLFLQVLWCKELQLARHRKERRKRRYAPL